MRSMETTSVPMPTIISRLAPRSLAPVISAFISRTASRMPTKTARLTIACPMCSSRMPGSAATGSTFT